MKYVKKHLLSLHLNLVQMVQQILQTVMLVLQDLLWSMEYVVCEDEEHSIIVVMVL